MGSSREAERKREENLILIAAVEEFGLRHNMASADVWELFKRCDLASLIRSQYEVLHTLPLEEGADFAEDVLKSRGVTY